REQFLRLQLRYSGEPPVPGDPGWLTTSRPIPGDIAAFVVNVGRMKNEKSANVLLNHIAATYGPSFVQQIRVSPEFLATANQSYAALDMKTSTITSAGKLLETKVKDRNRNVME